MEGNVAATSKKKMRNDFVEINFNSYRILNYNLIILGGFFFPEGLNHRSIFDKSVPVKQLDVVEPHNLLIFRCDKGTEIYQMHILKVYMYSTIDLPDQHFLY